MNYTAQRSNHQRCVTVGWLLDHTDYYAAPDLCLVCISWPLFCSRKNNLSF